MKWIIAILVVSLVAAGFWWQLNTTKVSYVNGLDAYADLPNREYILVKDTYVFAWRKSIATGFPLLGCNAPGVTTRVAALPEKFSSAEVGRTSEILRVMDAIPQGTRFRILSVRREESRRDGTVISFEIKFLDDLERPYQRVDIRPILLPVVRPGEAPAIDPTIAVPWIKR